MSFLDGNMGYEAFDKREEEIEEERASFVNRFWIPAEGDSTIIFMDDIPAVVEEHQIYHDGHWRNWYTCLSMVDEPCPICASGENPSLVAYYTIIDTAKWKNKQGKEFKNQIKLYGAKTSTMKILKRASKKLKEQGFPNGLKYAEFEVYRTDKDEVNVGNDITFTGKVYTEEELREINKDFGPLDYSTVLKPRSAEELQMMLGQTASEEYNNETQAEAGQNYEHKPIKF